MPLFEFFCSRCGSSFEELVRSADAIDQVRCPACESTEVQKKISTFASRSAGSRTSAYSSPAASCSTGSV